MKMGGQREHSFVNARASTLHAAPAEAAVERDARELFREHHAFVWRNARRLGCADDWVDDATQEVFLVAARRLHELSAEFNVRGWLFGIVFRVVQRMHRDRARYSARIQRYGATRATEHAPSVEGASEAARQLRELLLQLDESRRVIIILVELEGMTSAETAALLGIPQGTVDTRLRAARKQLQAILEHQRTLEARSAL
jgi:RNA polymerase sigma-70 factor (ECF subfamily)